MEGFKELVKITKICKEVNYIEECEMDENVRQLLVEEKKGKKVKELLVKGDEVERNAEIWKKIYSKFDFIIFFLVYFLCVNYGGKILGL